MKAESEFKDGAQAPQPEALPHHVGPGALPTELPRWAPWRWGRVEGKKPQKVPLRKVDEPKAWMGYEPAVEAARVQGYPGVGFLLGDGYVGLDFDGCLDDSGELTPEARELVGPFIGKSYVEVSPSGRGLHAILGGELPENTKEERRSAAGAKVEVYSRSPRYFTVTGKVFQGSGNLGEASAELAQLLRATAKPEAALSPAPSVEPAAPLPLAQLGLEFSKTALALPIVARAVREAKRCNYGEWITFAMALQGTFGGTRLERVARALFEELTRDLPGYQPGDEHKFEDFERAEGARVTMASIYKLADTLEPGWRKALDAGRGEASNEHVPLLATPYSELLADGRRVELPEYVVYPYIPRAMVSGLVGAGGSLKTAICQDLGLHIATGTKWGGEHPVKRGKVLHVSKEQPIRSIHGRTEAWLHGMATALRAEGLKEHALKERMDELRALIRKNCAAVGRDSPGAAELLLTVPRDYRSVAENEQAVDDLSRLAEGCAFVSIETLSRLHAGQENSNDDAARFIAALERVASRTGAHIMYVGHTGKAAQGGQYAGRGASAFSDNARGIFEAELVGGVSSGGTVTLRHMKPSEDGPRGEPVAWQPQRWIPPWVSQDGTQGSYVYLHPIDAIAAERAALQEHLMAKVREAGSDGVTLSHLREAVPGGRRQAAQRAAIPETMERLALLGEVERVEARREGVTRGKVPVRYRLPAPRATA